MNRHVLIITLVIVISGCDSLMGRPLVDTFRATQPGSEECEFVTTCDLNPSPIKPDIQPFDARSVACARTCDAGSCPPPSPTALQNSQRLTCKSVVLDLTSSAADLSNVSLENSVLSIRAADPTTITFHASNIGNSTIELSGPIALAFVDGSSITRTTIIPEHTIRGRPQFHVEGSRMSETHVDAEDDSVDFSAIRAFISSSALKSRRMRIESTSVVESDLESASFEIVDASIERSRLAGDGSLSASNVTESALGECEFLLIAGSDLKQTQLTGCQKLLRLYNDNIDGSFLDGTIEADSTGISRSVIGLLNPTDLLAFNVVTSESAFCEQLSQLRLDHGSMSCVSCSGPLERGEPIACQAPGAKLSLRKMVCPTLQTVSDCREPFPSSERQPGG